MQIVKGKNIMKDKVIHHYFMLPDFIEEQEFLMKQHASGWKFKSFAGLTKYKFEACHPEEYVYQLDYHDKDEDEESYLQLFCDYEWEYIMKVNHFYYFRKPKRPDTMDTTIFSDVDSQLGMCHQILKKQKTLFWVLLPFLVLFSLQLLHIFQDFNGAGPLLFSCSIFLLLNFLFIRNYIKLKKLISKFS